MVSLAVRFESRSSLTHFGERRWYKKIGKQDSLTRIRDQFFKAFRLNEKTVSVHRDAEPGKWGKEGARKRKEEELVGGVQDCRQAGHDYHDFKTRKRMIHFSRAIRLHGAVPGLTTLSNRLPTDLILETFGLALRTHFSLSNYIAGLFNCGPWVVIMSKLAR